MRTKIEPDFNKGLGDDAWPELRETKVHRIDGDALQSLYGEPASRKRSNPYGFPFRAPQRRQSNRSGILNAPRYMGYGRPAQSSAGQP